jgi:hypothetical protein
MVKYLVIFLCFVSGVQGYTNVTESKAMILTILQQKNPSVIPEIKDFFKRYDQSIQLFFDKSNNDSFSTHIDRMEGEVAEIEAVIEDERFAAIRHILEEQHEHLISLLNIFKRYEGSHSALSLAFKVRKFKFLLPVDVRKRGNLSLYKSLRHRLKSS